MFNGRMSARRLAVLLQHLPIESEYKTALRNDTDLSALPDPEPDVYGPWPQGDLLVARVGDLIERWIWMNADPEKRPKTPPEPYPRPGVDQSNVTPISPEAAAYNAAYMAYVRDNRRHPPDDWKPQTG